VDEIVHPCLTHCAHCNGTGGVQPNQYNPNGDCHICDNTGVFNPTDAAMAGLFDLTELDWRETWLPRYARIFGRFLEWNAIGSRHVKSRLKDED
jgi:hypothetical protein